MRATTFSLPLLAAALARAVQITSPTKNQVVDPVAGISVKWTTVASDPSTAHLFVVNMVAGGSGTDGPFSKDLGPVDLTKDGFVVVDASIPDGAGFQFNLQAVTQHNTGILAQSQQFEVKKSKKDDKDEEDSDASSTGTTLTKVATKTATGAASATASAAEGDADASSTPAPTATPSSGPKNGTAEVPVPTGAAVANRAVQGGSLLALIMGVVALAA